MATYIVLANFTEQGVRNARDTVKRAEAFKDVARKYGANVKEICWTLGRYDIIAICEGPDDASVTALSLALASQGNVRTETLRAFGAAEMKQILEKIA
ncbi:MAG TPA: GYD domain-containing protein [Hyphomicrobiales bacterium]|nr:GYD domain-containing protein [Hyphomicrobiales bacterium]